MCIRDRYERFHQHAIWTNHGFRRNSCAFRNRESKIQRKRQPHRTGPCIGPIQGRAIALPPSQGRTEGDQAPDRPRGCIRQSQAATARMASPRHPAAVHRGVHRTHLHLSLIHICFPRKALDAVDSDTLAADATSSKRTAPTLSSSSPSDISTPLAKASMPLNDAANSL